MSTAFSGKRLVLVLGVILLVGAAWYGGRMTASAGASHMGGMMHGEHSAGPSAAPFDGEDGAARCRAMMASMDDMHRSMQSMMGRPRGHQAVPDTGKPRSGMGRGMMGGRMEHDGGSMGDQRGQKHMSQMRHGEMGHMSRMGERMSREEMRGLCRAMHATMRDVMHGDVPGTTKDATDWQPGGDLDLESETQQWLSGTRGFETVQDRTGESEIVIEVGAGAGLSYAPAAVRVDPGTTIRWRWAGQGGLHDVAFLNADVSTSLRGEQGGTFTHTFTAPGEYRYECTPHAAVGMRGVVIVERR
jgi:halocyanin-like protein